MTWNIALIKRRKKCSQQVINLETSFSHLLLAVSCCHAASVTFQTTHVVAFQWRKYIHFHSNFCLECDFGLILLHIPMKWMAQVHVKGRVVVLNENKIIKIHSWADTTGVHVYMLLTTSRRIKNTLLCLSAVLFSVKKSEKISNH